MNLRKVFFNVAVAAAVAAVTAAGTSYLVLRYAPAGKLAGHRGRSRPTRPASKASCATTSPRTPRSSSR